MAKSKRYTAIDFSNIKPEQVERMLNDLYQSVQAEQRGTCFGQSTDRRQAERRCQDQVVLLDTRGSQSRRQSSGRRLRDENHDNKHKVGIDYYA